MITPGTLKHGFGTATPAGAPDAIATRLHEIRQRGGLRRIAEIGAVDIEARTAELSFSSEAAEVDRWFGLEVLSHAPGAVDLSRLNDGAPVLWMHNWNDQRGVVEAARIDSDRVGRATVRFSRSPAGEQLMQDVADRIISKVSIGYMVNGMRLLEERGDTAVYLVTEWQGLEISFVSVPADNTVGVGRGQEIPREEMRPATADASRNVTRESEHMIENMERRLPHLTDAQVRAQLEAMKPASRHHQPSPNPLAGLMADAARALGYREYGTADNPRREPFPAANRTLIDLSQFIADGNPSPNIHGVQNRPAGETLPLDPRAVIDAYSVVAKAGARIIIAHPRDRAIAIGGEKTEGLIGFFKDPQLVRNVEPAQFATLADGADVASSAIPTHDATFTWPDTPTAAFRVTVTRAQNRAVGGGEDLRTALLDAILRGVAEYADKLLLAAIAAATPAPFTFGLAAAKHLQEPHLRAITNGTGAGYRGDGVFSVQGVPAMLSAQSTGAYIGAFGTAAVAVWPELAITATRLNLMGDLDITVMCNAQAVLPDAGKFWTAA